VETTAERGLHPQTDPGSRANPLWNLIPDHLKAFIAPIKLQFDQFLNNNS
jgi:hypothetical protein